MSLSLCLEKMKTQKNATLTQGDNRGSFAGYILFIANDKQPAKI
jgi:hypothetical protein